MLEDKKVAILGDRDGIPGPAIEECLKAAGAEIVFSTTKSKLLFYIHYLIMFPYIKSFFLPFFR
jgi:glycine reductase